MYTSEQLKTDSISLFSSPPQQHSSNSHLPDLLASFTVHTSKIKKDELSWPTSQLILFLFLNPQTLKAWRIAILTWSIIAPNRLVDLNPPHSLFYLLSIQIIFALPYISYHTSLQCSGDISSRNTSIHPLLLNNRFSSSNLPTRGWLIAIRKKGLVKDRGKCVLRKRKGSWKTMLLRFNGSLVREKR